MSSNVRRRVSPTSHIVPHNTTQLYISVIRNQKGYSYSTYCKLYDTAPQQRHREKGKAKNGLQEIEIRYHTQVAKGNAKTHGNEKPQVAIVPRATAGHYSVAPTVYKGYVVSV